MLRYLYPEKKRILLDSNLFVVLLIGQSQNTLFGQNPVKEYTMKDYDILVNELSDFDEIQTTPYILSEVNGHITKAGNNGRRRAREALLDFLPRLSIIDIHPLQIFDSKYYVDFGLTDVSILKAASQDTFVLTADGKLVGILNNEEITSWSYKDLRESTYSIY